MKKKMTLVAGLALALIMIAFNNSNAQATGEPAVKVVPATSGMVKVIYALGNDKPVHVRIYDAEGFSLSDKISTQSFDRGFIKKYDIKKLAGSSYWMEISTRDFSATYKLQRSGDGKQWAPVLESTTYSFGLLAAN